MASDGPATPRGESAGVGHAATTPAPHGPTPDLPRMVLVPSAPWAVAQAGTNEAILKKAAESRQPRCPSHDTGGRDGPKLNSVRASEVPGCSNDGARGRTATFDPSTLGPCGSPERLRCSSDRQGKVAPSLAAPGARRDPRAGRHVPATAWRRIAEPFSAGSTNLRAAYAFMYLRSRWRGLDNARGRDLSFVTRLGGAVA